MKKKKKKLIIVLTIPQCCLLLSMMSPNLVGEPMKAEHMHDSVNIILSLQVSKERENQISILINKKKIHTHYPCNFFFCYLYIFNCDYYSNLILKKKKKKTESKWWRVSLGANRSSKMVGGK